MFLKNKLFLTNGIINNFFLTQYALMSSSVNGYIFRSILKNKKGLPVKPYKKKGPKIIVSGPPFLNKNIHWGTVYNVLLKNYYQVANKVLNEETFDLKSGFDVHGLPTDLKVFELMGLSKTEALKDPIKLIKVSQQYVADCKSRMLAQFGLLKLYQPIITPYATNDKQFYETVWSTYKQLKELGLVYYALKCRAYCVNCVDSLANIEVEKKVKKFKGVYYRYKLLNLEDTFILIWTTTPWTIAGTAAIAFNENAEYSVWYSKKDNTYLYASKYLKKKLINALELSYINDIATCELNNLKYVFNNTIYECGAASWVQYSTKFVKKPYLTGFVNIAPLYDSHDLDFAITKGLKINALINDYGYFTYYFDKNLKISNELEILDILSSNIVTTLDLTREVEVCYRCKTKVIQYATYQYFLKITDNMKATLLNLIKKVQFNDLIYKEGFIHWLENAHDWCISRKRVFGIPIPQISDKVVTSFEELGITSVQELYMVLPTLKNTGFVFDCWFESGCVHIHHYLKTGHISEYFIEGLDQTRGWLYTSSVLFSTLYYILPYKKVHMHGFLLDTNKQKLSKSKLANNYSFNDDLNSMIGSDILILKWYMYSLVDWTHARFHRPLIKIYEKKYIIVKSLLAFFKTQSGDSKIKKDGSHNFEFITITLNIIKRLDTLVLALKESLDHMDTKACIDDILSVFINQISRLDLKLLKYYDKKVTISLKEYLYSVITNKMQVILSIYDTNLNVKPYAHTDSNFDIVKKLISLGFKNSFRGCFYYVYAFTKNINFESIFKNYEMILKQKILKKIALKEYIFVGSLLFSNLKTLEKQMVCKLANVVLNNDNTHIEGLNILKDLNIYLRTNTRINKLELFVDDKYIKIILEQRNNYVFLNDSVLTLQFVSTCESLKELKKGVWIRTS